MFTLNPMARPAMWAVLLFALSAVGGCRKPEQNLGDELVDPAALLGTVTFDTATIQAWTQFDQPSTTSGLSRNVLGSYLDPVFGQVSAGIITQLRLSSNNVGQGVDTSVLVCDSLVLGLTYDATTYGYGGLEPQSFKVLRLNEDLSADSTYKSSRVPTCFQEDLLASGQHTFTPDPKNGPHVGGDTLDPQLRLRLKTSLGQELLSHWGSNEVTTSDAFVAYFKGLYILPADEGVVPFQRAALYFNLLSGESKMTVYYRNTATSETLAYDFVINSSCVRYTHSTFDHQQAIEPLVTPALTDTAVGQESIFLQALGGAEAELRFPSLDRYKDQGYSALAKAELILPISGGYYPLYAPPAQVFVFRKGDDGEDLILPDQQLVINDVGGVYDATTKEYRLTVTRWVQGVLTGRYPNTGLSLVAGGRGVTANRTVLSGPAASDGPMRLRLTFTTY